MTTDHLILDPREPIMAADEIEYPVPPDDDFVASRSGFVNAAAKRWYDANEALFTREDVTLSFVRAVLAEIANLRERVKALEAKG